MIHRIFKGWLLLLVLAASGTGMGQTRIDLQGHRGARGLLPENTLAGFQKALALGVTTLELDVVMTQDEVLVISHDTALNPAITRNAQGQFLATTGPHINTLSYQALQAYDVGRINPGSSYGRIFREQQPADGQKIPRLADLFELVRRAGNEKIRFAIETKVSPLKPDASPAPERLAEALVKEIQAHGLIDRVQILSFDWRSLQYVQKLGLGIPTVYVTAQLPELDNLMRNSATGSPWTAGFAYAQYGSVPEMIKAAGGSHWSSFWRELDAGKVRQAQQLGLQVLAWTVNDKRVMNQMLDMGVNGLITDRPDLAIEVLTQRKIEWTTWP